MKVSFYQKSFLKCIGIALMLGSILPSQAQSLEIMPGDKRVFTDVQWLKFLDTNYRFSLFSRTRATVNYDNETSFFTAAYFNYTSPIDVGLTLVGKLNDQEGGGDIGIHLLKSKTNWTLFGLLAIGLKEELEYSWFSIFRFTPAINDKWKLYTSLELFTLMNNNGHAFSVQRIRAGVDRNGYQFGLGNNLSEIGTRPSTDNNFGVFLRKSF